MELDLKLKIGNGVGLGALIILGAFTLGGIALSQTHGREDGELEVSLRAGPASEAMSEPGMQVPLRRPEISAGPQRQTPLEAR
ncbi:hypothetical protein JIP62_06930 [Brevundimonas vitis]|uniref:Uncharacterized protein n=1 Tax=Brevundimonas vitisensis TaxID=2800818 RepID=A0ABX7BQD9_9CAUL|nr:hypothetical protein [Brevundimonas vitisensis]QQQ19812.1 hypothetical protein JIP62_06930 [Brevundimonas vitisensis]